MAAAYRFGHSMISDHLPTHNGFLQTSNALLKVGNYYSFFILCG